MKQDLIEKIDSAMYSGRRILVAGHVSGIKEYASSKGYSVRNDEHHPHMLHIKPTEVTQ